MKLFIGNHALKPIGRSVKVADTRIAFFNMFRRAFFGDGICISCKEINLSKLDN